MKKENRNKTTEEVKDVAPVTETEKEEKEIQVNQDKKENNAYFIM